MSLYTAIHLAKRTHDIEHGLGVLHTLWSLDLDLPAEAYMAAVLHDVLEEASISYDEVLYSVGAEAAAVVRALSKDDVYYSLHKRVREKVYLMRLQAMNKTYGYALLIACADRLNLLQHSSLLSDAEAASLRTETIKVYLPFLKDYRRETAIPFPDAYRKAEEAMQYFLSLSRNTTPIKRKILTPPSPPSHTSPY